MKEKLIEQQDGEDVLSFLEEEYEAFQRECDLISQHQEESFGQLAYYEAKNYGEKLFI